MTLCMSMGPIFKHQQPRDPPSPLLWQYRGTSTLYASLAQLEGSGGPADHPLHFLVSCNIVPVRRPLLYNENLRKTSSTSPLVFPAAPPSVSIGLYKLWLHLHVSYFLLPTSTSNFSSRRTQGCSQVLPSCGEQKNCKVSFVD